MKFLDDAALDHLRQVADEPDLSGTKYELVKPLGRGGMGSVYAVHDRELEREVALKVTTDTEISARLWQEARVLAKLEHPGIVPVHDFGTLPDGRTYYCMKLVRGERLDRWAARNDLRAALRLLQRICEAVAFAHAHGVVHRDLKPENVMVGEFGEALVMDWGIATELAAPESAVMGTPLYMAPEQARGEAPDVRTDVHGLGAILYFLLAARPPYSALEGAPDPLPRSTPSPLVSICLKALAKDPTERYATAAELGEDVSRWLDAEPVSAHRESMLELIGRFASRHRVVLSLLGAYLILRLVLALVP